MKKEELCEIRQHELQLRGAASGTGRVLRGGSLIGSTSSCTVVRRSSNNHYFLASGIGFRFVRPWSYCASNTVLVVFY